MESTRKPTFKEIQLIEFLAQKAKIKLSEDWNVKLLVKPLNDGGMGSLQLIPEGVKNENERFLGKQVSEFQYFDKDGIEVIASLNIDDKGRLFELDLWKTDFSPLIGFPESFV